MSNSDEILDIRRDLLYAGASVFSIAILALTWNPLESVLTHQSLPLPMIGFIVGAELLKIFICRTGYPASANSYYSQTSEFNFETTTSAKFSSFFDLPIFRSRSNSNSKASRSDLIIQIVDALQGIFGFIFFVALCHVLLVLFGAPFFQDWVLTLQFSIILTTWLFLPFTVIIRPPDVLTCLYYMSAWGKLNSTFVRHKWRYILTILGAWGGAVVVPLDWDAPWQRWPIPSFYSVTASHFLINLAYFLYLSYELYGHKLRKLLPRIGIRRTSKTKAY